MFRIIGRFGVVIS